MKGLKCLIPAAITAMMLYSCSNVETIGPDLSDIYSKVEVVEGLSVNKNNPNFSTGDKVAFSAKFAKDTYWKMSIKGNTSGATRSFTGTSKTIDPARIVWDGKSDGPQSFIVETAAVQVIFPYSPGDTLKLNLTITGVKNHNTAAVTVNDFGTFVFTDIDWPTTLLSVDNVIYPTIAGNYLLMRGTAKPGMGNFVGYLGIRATQSGHTSGVYPLYANASLVYLNLMVYGTGDKVRLRVNVLENDVESRYIDVIPDWTGWKLISVRYTDLLSPDPLNPITPKPQNVTDIGLVYFTNETDLSKVVTIPVDKIIFTHNGPYQP